ncbi:MAG: hypothetical protein LBC31_11810 [Treponema sp.]|jgi:hypothetical protein|nr:hypothetical protein [Treponema sp.]
MARDELFSTGDIRECRKPLSRTEGEAAAGKIIRAARMGIQYFYSIREACGILHCTYDELMTALSLYRLDAVLFLSVYRIPWWDLAGYLLDRDNDLEEALNEYLRKIARRNSGGPLA